MLLEAAMAELHEDAAASGKSRDTDLVLDTHREDDAGGPPDVGHETRDVNQEDDGNTNADFDGVSLLHGVQQFASRLLNHGPSNLGESSRFGSYRSTAVAAGKVPFQWEAQPGKAKNPVTIAEEDDDLPPLSLPPIRLSPNLSVHRISPSSSTTPSPRSLTGKVKSLIINHVKKPSLDHFSFINGTSEPHLKSPSKIPSQNRTRRERKLSTLSNGSAHSSVSSYHNSNPYNRNGHIKADENGPRSSLNSSDPSSSPYYFSSLSNSSYQMSHGVLSPRPSVEQSSSGSNSNTYSHASVSSHMLSGGSNSSSSSIASTVMRSPNGLASCLLFITSMTNGESISENADSVHGSNGVLSFASPEMEVLDEGSLSTGNHKGNHNTQGAMATMDDFINRGGLQMNRSLSTSRLTFTDDFGRKLSQKSQYYSSQLSSKGTREPMNHLSPNLDELFPLKPPKVMKVSGDIASKYKSQSAMVSKYSRQSSTASNYNSPSANDSPIDGQFFEDALDSSLDSSVISADDGEMKSIIESIMNPHGLMERPAQEVVMEAHDENEFAFNSPVASAFVFSPRKGSPPPQRTMGQQRKLSNIKSNAQSHLPTSILKKSSSQELNKAGNGGSWPNVLQQKSLNNCDSQKISSALLRFAEAEEQLLNKSRNHRHHHQGGVRSTACMKPMCYALGRAFLCRSSKLSR